MPPAAIEFFLQEAKARSLAKLDLYRKYLKPLVYKLGSVTGPGRKWRHVWVIDAFAGAGRYQPDDGGPEQDGSPLIAAKWARDVELDRNFPLVRCINVERDPACFESLRVNLAPWKHLVTNHEGAFEDHVDTILTAIQDDPALIFLDPFGVNGIEMTLVERLLARKGKTELLIHFSDKTFARMAGHLGDGDKRLPIGQKLAESKLVKLDALIGTPMWRRLWSGKVADFDAAMDATVGLYLAELRTRVKYAHPISMRDHHADRPAYRLVFCTNSAHGVEMVSDLACAYEARLKDEAVAGAVTLWADEEARERLTQLRDAVQARGVRRGTATRQELIHELSSELFGLYRKSEYAKVIRELVNMGVIDRVSQKGISEGEPLKFVEPEQGSLLNPPAASSSSSSSSSS